MRNLVFVIIFFLTCSCGYRIKKDVEQNSQLETSQPEISKPTISIITILEGSDADNIEMLISNPIEKSLSDLENIKQIHSVSENGKSTIEIEFETYVNTDDELEIIKDLLNNIKSTLPEATEKPMIMKSEVVFYKY